MCKGGSTIILSTRFVKQHTILDVIGAVVMANRALRLAKIIEEMGVTWGKKRSFLKSVSVLDSGDI